MESKKLRSWQPQHANRVFDALRRIGWTVKMRPDHAYYILEREGYPDYIWPFPDDLVMGVCALKRIATNTGLRTEDLLD
jgi:hypothetical protein